MYYKLLDVLNDARWLYYKLLDVLYDARWLYYKLLDVLDDVESWYEIYKAVQCHILTLWLPSSIITSISK